MTRVRTALLAVLFLWGGAVAYAVIPVPALRGPVMDEAALLNADETRALESELRQYPPAVQLQIWIVPTLDGEPIETASIRATDQWKLGTAKGDRGVLLLVAVKDRRARLEIGQGLEGELPDTLTARIIDGVLVPSFRAGDYGAGIRQVARAVYQQAGGDPAKLGYEAAPPPPRKSRRSGWLDLLILLVLFIFVGIGRLAGGGRGSRFRGGGWGGGGWGGGFGGGGGWSGGGGRFQWRRIVGELVNE